MKRNVPVRRVNRKRRRERFNSAFGEKVLWLVTLPCALPGCLHRWQHVVAAHVKSRGAGGTSKHLIPLCRLHHDYQHRIGIKSFAAEFHVDLHALAEKYEDMWAAGIY